MPFEYPESVSLCHLPTPIEKLGRLSRELEGPNLFVKRDDMTGAAVTGNKIRKLEFLLAEAVEQNCNVVITCGSSQSNHARSTAIAAAKLGLSSCLVLRNSFGREFDGNLFLDRLVGAELRFVTAEEYLKVDSIMSELAEELRAKGSRPYVVPEGGSNALGALGYLRACEEIARQVKSMRLRLHHIVVAVGSGGTYAGLLMGKYLFDLGVEIHGINVCDDAAFFRKRIVAILREAKKRFRLDFDFKQNDIKIIDGYVGKGYALSSQEEIDTIKRVAQSEGIVLDPVYTGKAMRGLVDQIRQGHFKAGENVLFIHTGGIFGLFPKRSLFF
ncbi:MAG: D-cysteine desulfhydrase family protein [bacterium]